MRVKVAKWGNSLAVRLPKAAARELGATPGQDVELSAGDGRVILSGVRRRLTIADLVAEASALGPLESPALIDWGPDRGAEILPEEDWSALRRLTLGGR